jgi:mRNA interferase MazF
VKDQNYVPERGDLVWLNFTPQAGHEQQGLRPAIVISPSEYNRRVGLGLFCPITKHKKGYPFEVELRNAKIKGVVLSDHIKSLDWKIRSIEFIGKADSTTLASVCENLKLLIF